MDISQDCCQEFSNEVEIVTEISENDSTIGDKSTTTNSLPGTSSSQQNEEEWNITFNSVSATEDNMAQPHARENNKKIIIKLCQPKKVQKLTKVTDASSSLTPNDVRGSRKRTHHQRTLEEISNVVDQAAEPINSSPVLDLEQLTSWGMKKKKVIPQASTFSNSSSHTSHVLEENNFENKEISEPIQEILYPWIFLTNSSSHTSRVLEENKIEMNKENVDPQVCDSNNSSQKTFPLLAWHESYVLPDESTWEKSSSEESSELMEELSEEEKSYLDWFNKMKTTHTDDWNGFGPRYTEDEIWMDKKRSPNVMWSSAQRPYSEEHFLLMYTHERQKIIKNKEEKYFKERLEYLSQFYAKEEKVPM